MIQVITHALISALGTSRIYLKTANCFVPPDESVYVKIISLFLKRYVLGTEKYCSFEHPKHV